MQQFGLGPRDLLSGLGFLVLVQLLHLVTVLDRVFDQLLHVVEVGVAHRGQLDRWQVEVVLDAVLMRTAISESRPSSISGTSHGRSSGS